MKPAIYMLCGFIGSGKTTYAIKLSKELSAFVLNTDQFTVGLLGNDPGRKTLDKFRDRIEGLQLKLAGQLLDLGVSVIFDRGFWSRRVRDELRAFGSQRQLRVEMIYLTAPEVVMRERAISRSAQLDDETFFISGPIWDELYPSFEPPMQDEIYQVIRTA